MNEERILLFTVFLLIAPVLLSGFTEEKETVKNQASEEKSMASICDCHVETGDPYTGIGLYDRPDGHLIEFLEHDTEVSLQDSFPEFVEGGFWYKVSLSQQIGFIRNSVNCEKMVPNKEVMDNLIYFEELLSDTIFFVEPKDRASQDLIKKHYKAYLRNLKYKSIPEEGLKRMLEQDALSMIYEISEEESVPFGIVFQALIEAQWFNHDGNHASAAGFWQFIDKTGKWMNLISGEEDKRGDPRASTRAAVLYMQKLAFDFEWHAKRKGYTVTESDIWNFALCAYNRGPGNVFETFYVLEGKYYGYPDQFAHAPYEYRETRNYVPKFYGLRQAVKVYVDEVTMPKYYSPADLAWEGYKSQKDSLDPSDQILAIESIENLYTKGIEGYKPTKDGNSNFLLAQIKKERTLIESSEDLAQN
jgi:hypothetical protein